MNIFSPNLKRFDLLQEAKRLKHAWNLNSKASDSIEVRVHRNFAFEVIEALIAPFLATSNLRLSFRYGDYDDSFAFGGLGEARLDLVCMDLTRYSLDMHGLLEFMRERIEVLASSKSDCLVLMLGDSKLRACDVIDRLIALDDSGEDKGLLANEESGGLFSEGALVLGVPCFDIHRLYRERARLVDCYQVDPKDALQEAFLEKIESKALHSMASLCDGLPKDKACRESKSLPNPMDSIKPKEDIEKGLIESKDPFFHENRQSFSGSRLSNHACIAMAQILGLKLIPSLLLTNIKAIVCDLDNTLYDGVLGEDGAHSLRLEASHMLLQNLLINFKKRGVLLAAASKNDLQDARDLFKTRRDFPLRWEDFDCAEVNWNAKLENLNKIARHFNIALDSMLFIDDNPAEIEALSHTGIQCLLAIKNQVPLHLYLYPRLTKLKLNKEDSLRAKDLASKAHRQSLQALPTHEYFANLKLSLSLSLDNKSLASRIHELMNKTNQFIASYTRPSPGQVAEWLDSKNHCAACIGLKDRLSDSGIIGIVIGRLSNDYIEVLDMVVSCRALGRRLEEIMLYLSLDLMSKAFRNRFSTQVSKAIVHYKEGQRNTPFLNFIKALNARNPQTTQSPLCIELIKPNTDGLIISIERGENEG